MTDKTFRVDTVNDRIQPIDIDQFIQKKKGSKNPLIGLGSFIIDCQTEWKINALFITAVMIHESGWGQSNYATKRNNLFGLRARTENPDMSWTFRSKEGSIQKFCRVITALYLSSASPYYVDRTIGGINQHYSVLENGQPNTEWSADIVILMNQIEEFLG